MHREAQGLWLYQRSSWLVLWLLAGSFWMHVWHYSIGAPLVLSEPVSSSGQFRFTLSGESNAAYIVETSTNLQNWKAVSTNTSAAASRAILAAALEQQAFYRARQAAPFFGYAIATVKGYLYLDTGSLTTDSFDSANPVFSTDGLYDPAKAKDGGHIGTYFGVGRLTNFGLAQIYGHLFAGPHATISLGPNDAVGSTSWQLAGNTGIEPGWSSEDMAAAFPNVKAPFTNGLAPLRDVVWNGVFYDFLLVNGNYWMSSGTLSGRVLVAGNVALNLEPYTIIALHGEGGIWLLPDAILNLYVNSIPTVDLSDNGVQSLGPGTQFHYWGTTNNTRIKLGVKSAFNGTFYAPKAEFTLTGSSNDVLDFSGSIISKTLRVNGAYRFHYDENLKCTGPFY